MRQFGKGFLNMENGPRKWVRRKYSEIRQPSPELNGIDAEELVRRTISQSEAEGLPARSRARIQRGMEKLNVEEQPVEEPQPKVVVKRKGPVLLVVALVALAVFVPGWTLLLVAMSLLLILIAVMGILGVDRLAAMGKRWFRRYHERDPEAAEKLRRRAARVSSRLSWGLEKLPESWTRGLYLPDFAPHPEPPAKMKADPFERLSV